MAEKINVNERPRWETEDWKVKLPDDNICCKTCCFRLPDMMINGETLKRHTYGFCSVYPQGTDGKPHDVLWEGAKCLYHTEGDPE